MLIDNNVSPRAGPFFGMANDLLYGIVSDNTGVDIEIRIPCEDLPYFADMALNCKPSGNLL
jgi:hypothetical protein